MTRNYKYLAFFVKPDELRKAVEKIRLKPLENVIQRPHVTYCYRPERVDRKLFGRTIGITAVGYGNDGNNEGLLVQLHTDDPELQAMCGQIEVPHITIAVSSVGAPVNTRFLDYSPIQPFEIIGTFGAYTYTDRVVVRGRRKRNAEEPAFRSKPDAANECQVSMSAPACRATKRGG